MMAHSTLASCLHKHKNQIMKSACKSERTNSGASSQKQGIGRISRIPGAACLRSGSCHGLLPVSWPTDSALSNARKHGDGSLGCHRNRKVHPHLEALARIAHNEPAAAKAGVVSRVIQELGYAQS